MGKELISVELTRESGSIPWGIRLGGGKDRGRVHVLEKVVYQGLGHVAGLMQKDYIVKVNGTSVFGLDHEPAKQLIKDAGNRLHLEVERGDFIVPSLDEAFPKKKVESEVDPKSKPYWIQAIEQGQGSNRSKGFTTCGKPRMAQKQYNSPLEMYSEEAIEEIMKEGTLNGKPFNMENLMNPSGKDFDQSTSAVLDLINSNAEKVQNGQNRNF